LDWLQDRISPSGQFQAQIAVGPKDPVTARFAWHFRMSIPGGGFIPVKDDELPLLAPEDGYQETIEIVHDPDLPQKDQLFPTQYYIAFGQPRMYGRIKMQLSPHRIEFYKESIIFLWYWINPSGGRSLEGDPKEGIPSIFSGQLKGGR
jgi:hypothetical protein